MVTDVLLASVVPDFRHLSPLLALLNQEPGHAASSNNSSFALSKDAGSESGMTGRDYNPVNAQALSSRNSLP